MQLHKRVSLPEEMRGGKKTQLPEPAIRLLSDNEPLLHQVYSASETRKTTSVCIIPNIYFM